MRNFYSSKYHSRARAGLLICRSALETLRSLPAPHKVLIRAILMGTLLVSPPISIAAYKDVVYSRELLRAEQASAEQLIAAATREHESAARLLAVRFLPEGCDELVRANFHLDRAESQLAGHADRIRKLRSAAFSYIRSDEQKKLLASYSGLLERVRECRNQTAALHEKALSAGEEAAHLLQIYLLQETNYVERIRQGLTDADAVIVELRPLLRFPWELVRSGMIHPGNVAQCSVNPDGTVSLPNGTKVSVGPKKPAERVEANEQHRITELKAATEALRDQVQRLRENVLTKKPVVITNEIRTIIERLAPNPKVPILQRALTNNHQPMPVLKAELGGVSIPVQSASPPASLTNAHAVTHVAEQRRTPPLSTNKPPKSMVTTNAPNPGSFAKSNTSELYAIPFPQGAAMVPKNSTIESKLRTRNQPASDRPYPAKERSRRGSKNRLLAAGSAAMALASLALLACIRWNKRRFDITLAEIGADDSATPITLMVQPGVERIVLGSGEPRVEPADLACEFPAAIHVGFLGRITISPGTARVIVRNISVETSARIQVGDQIEVQLGNAGTSGGKSYVLRDVSIGAADSPPEIPQSVALDNGKR